MEVAPPDSARTEAAQRYCLDPGALVAGNDLQLLVDGREAFPAMLTAIRNAESDIWLETYIFESDTTGSAFVNALIDRALLGIRVCLIMDAFGAMQLSAQDERRMRGAGIQLRYYGRFHRVHVRRWLRRDHRKLLLIDGSLAFVGGINLNDDYADADDGGKNWHDLHLKVMGPLCENLGEIFAANWRCLDGPVLPTVSPAAKAGSEHANALISGSGERFRIRSTMLHAIRAAKQEILIASAYFLPDRGLVRALEKKARRGVEVRLLVPGHSDIQSVQWAGEHLYDRLLGAGIHIHPWRHTHMHAKAVAVDRTWACIGSYNLDYMSLLYNLELVVVAVGGTLPNSLSDQLLLDCSETEKLDVALWHNRPLSSKLRDKLAYRFRRWL